MCGSWCFDIVRRSMVYWPSKPKTLEVGSYNVNGSVRGICESLCSSYTGVDIQDGPGVDYLVNAEQLIETFGPEAFDMVISTEMLEHVENWALCVYNMASVLKVGGLLILTTRDQPMYYHGFPGDYWRFSPDDLRQIFAPIGEIISAEKDTDEQAWGSGIIMRRTSDDLAGWHVAIDHFPMRGVDTPRETYAERQAKK